jgi:hypothetical protein
MNKKLSNQLFITLAAATQMSSAQISYVQITSDADSGISSDMTFTHAIDFGTSGVATVNGVLFANDVNQTADGRANSGSRTYSPNHPHPGNTPPAVSGNIASVFQDMRYNGPDLGSVELTGLTPGEFYELRLYERAWDANAIRTFSLDFDIGANGSIEASTPEINQNNPTLPTPGFAANVSYALVYKYQADDSGSLRITVDLADGSTGSYHLYGLTNAVDPDGSAAYLVSLDNNIFSTGGAQGTLVGSLAGSLEGNPDPSTFTLVAGNGDTDNGKFQINGDRLEIGNFDFSGAEFTDGQQFSIRIQGVGSSTTERVLLLTLLRDDDNDRLNDDWELQWATDLTILSGETGEEDLDQDGLTNLEEFRISRGNFGSGVPAYPNIDPTDDDSDDDTLSDDEEINPVGPRLQTNPTAEDTDGDELSDAVESNSGTFTDANNTGTDPTLCDTDGDYSIDSWEVTHNSDPVDVNSYPNPVGPVAIVPMTDDASTGLDPAKTYTHLVSGGQPSTVNGVTFETVSPTISPANVIWDSMGRSMNQVIANNGDWDPVAAGVSANVETLLGSFTYSGNGPNPGDTQRFTLTGLSPGASYDLRIYSRQWDTEGSGRPSDLVFTNGDETVRPFGFLPLDRPGILTRSGIQTDAYYLTYQYTAQTTELIVDATVPLCAPPNSGSFHMYALSNEIASGAPLGQILITNQVLLSDGRFAIAFQGKPQTTYQVTKSANLVGNFLPLDPPLSATTDINGEGQAVISAGETSEAKKFFRIEE